MPSTAAPYGCLPVKTLGGGARIQRTPYKILNGYTTSIFYGDVVKLGSDGTCQKDTGTSTATPLGIFLGCQYTDSTLGFISRQYWPASTVAADAIAFVADDPDMVFMVQSASAVAQADLGQNAALVQGSGSTATGKSAVTIGSLNTSSTLPVRIIGFSESPLNAPGDTYCDVLCIWNTPWLRVATGV